MALHGGMLMAIDFSEFQKRIAAHISKLKLNLDMDKFTIYEILSFIVPGYMLLGIVDFINNQVLGNAKLYNADSLKDNIILLGIALFLGLIIHVLTMKFFNKMKWYKFLVYHTPQKISLESSFCKKVMPYINEEYIRLKKHEESLTHNGEAEPYLYDFAYYYLEISDKIATVKNFQSLYFGIRNVFTLCLISIPFVLLLLIFLWVQDYGLCAKWNAIYLLLGIILLGLVIIPIARWLRNKLVEKVFWTFYLDRIKENLEKN